MDTMRHPEPDRVEESMPLTMQQSYTIGEMAKLLVDFLPASFNNTTSFPIAAKNASVSHHWQYEGGKRGSIARMLKASYLEDRRKFLSLVKQIVDLGLVYRGRADKPPILRTEIVCLNELLLELGLRIRSLGEPSFLDRLSTDAVAAGQPGPTVRPVENADPVAKEHRDRQDRLRSERGMLKAELMRLTAGDVDPQARGYMFETFLNRMFESYGMAPRKPFRNRGEQIDGSFVHRHDTFLLEAKWQAKETAVRDLYVFASKVETKAAWGRGLFISHTGFTDEGLEAFHKGKPTSIVCMDGLDLFMVLEHGLDMLEVIDGKKRHAVETGHAFVSILHMRPDLS